MKDLCKVYIDRIRDGEFVPIKEELSSAFMDVQEKELRFETPVLIEGEANIADREVAVHVRVSTTAKILCSICNELFDYPITIDSFFTAKPLVEIQDHIFDFGEALREAILLEIPYVAECSNGACPERASIQKYLASPEKPKDETWNPFTDL